MKQQLARGLAVLLTIVGMAVWLAVPAGAQEMKIGFFAPITGPVAADGASAKQSVELAVKEVNAAGGIMGKKVELIVYDDRLNPRRPWPSPTSSSRRIRWWAW